MFELAERFQKEVQRYYYARASSFRRTCSVFWPFGMSLDFPFVEVLPCFVWQPVDLFAGLTSQVTPTSYLELINAFKGASTARCDPHDARLLGYSARLLRSDFRTAGIEAGGGVQGQVEA